MAQHMQFSGIFLSEGKEMLIFSALFLSAMNSWGGGGESSRWQIAGIWRLVRIHNSLWTYSVKCCSAAVWLFKCFIYAELWPSLWGFLERLINDVFSPPLSANWQHLSWQKKLVRAMWRRCRLTFQTDPPSEWRDASAWRRGLDTSLNTDNHTETWHILLPKLSNHSIHLTEERTKGKKVEELLFCPNTRWFLMVLALTLMNDAASPSCSLSLSLIGCRRCVCVHLCGWGGCGVGVFQGGSAGDVTDAEWLDFM